MTKPTVKIEMYSPLNLKWFDITCDVVSEIKASYGIRGNAVTDRSASVGQLRFTVRNDAGAQLGINTYTPYSVNALEDWKKGAPVRLTLSYKTEQVQKFYGHISELTIDLELQRVDVLCQDWLDYAETYPMRLSSYTEDKRIDEVVSLIVSGMNHQPQATRYANGINTFTSIFDTVKNDTRAIGELQKLALSEMGFIYLRQDPYSGEMLVVDSMTTRDDYVWPIQIPKLGDYLIIEGGNLLTTEDGNQIVLNSLQYVELDNKASDVRFNYGNRIINEVSAKVYPRRVDTTEQVLFSLDDPVYLAAGSSITLELNYKDPTNESSSVAGKDMVTPVATTDYLLNSKSDGTGTNLTSSLTINTTFYGTKALLILRNTSATNGYITKLQLRGYGIYLYNSMDYGTQYLESQNTYGLHELSLDLKYLNDPNTAKYYADLIIADYRNPEPVVDSFTFLANKDETTLLTFLFADLGDFVKILDDKAHVTTYSSNYYFINGIDFTITLGGNISFTWIVTSDAGILI